MWDSKTEFNDNGCLCVIVLPAWGTQVSHDMHSLHSSSQHMIALHKLLCGLPVDDLWFWDTTIPAKYATQTYHIIV